MELSACGACGFAVPKVKFESLSGIKDGPDLPELVKLVRSYLLSNFPDFFLDAASVTEKLVVSESFAGKVEEACSCSWVFVDCFDKDINLIQMVTSYKKFPAAAAADEKSPDVSPPDAMCVQRCVPNQHSRN